MLINDRFGIGKITILKFSKKAMNKKSAFNEIASIY